MLIGLTVRDVVLIKSLDLEVGEGMTALTGETGAGKSILLDALGLALGRRADPGLVRVAAGPAAVTATFQLPKDHPAFALLDDRGLAADPGEPLTLRRQLSADGRSRAFVNDQPVSVAVLKELAALLVEVHGQHETVGLLDSRNHRPLLDLAPEIREPAAATAAAWRAYTAARDEAAAFEARAAAQAEAAETRDLRIAELKALNPQVGEESRLQSERALLGAAEKALADIEAARAAFSGDQVSGRLAGAFRAIERARERAVQAGAGSDAEVVKRLSAAVEALDRAMVEAGEAEAAVEAAGAAFDFEPDRLERAEERLFALRALARRLGTSADELPAVRAALEAEAAAAETLEADLLRLRRAAAAALDAYKASAKRLSEARAGAAARLAEAVAAELTPLKLDRARFRVALLPLDLDRAGPHGLEQVEFQITTNPGAPFGALGAIASGGELARIALALKAALADRGEGVQPVMIFDEVDQGVGGAVADAVGQRLRRLSRTGQVVLVTHSPQIAARADVHWKVRKGLDAEGAFTTISDLGAVDREEEIARMLSGETITPAARAAARALMDA